MRCARKAVDVCIDHAGCHGLYAGCLGIQDDVVELPLARVEAAACWKAARDVAGITHCCSGAGIIEHNVAGFELAAVIVVVQNVAPPRGDACVGFVHARPAQDAPHLGNQIGFAYAWPGSLHCSNVHFAGDREGVANLVDLGIFFNFAQGHHSLNKRFGGMMGDLVCRQIQKPGKQQRGMRPAGRHEMDGMALRLPGRKVVSQRAEGAHTLAARLLRQLGNGRRLAVPELLLGCVVFAEQEGMAGFGVDDGSQACARRAIDAYEIQAGGVLTEGIGVGCEIHGRIGVPRQENQACAHVFAQGAPAGAVDMRCEHAQRRIHDVAPAAGLAPLRAPLGTVHSVAPEPSLDVSSITVQPYISDASAALI